MNSSTDRIEKQIFLKAPLARVWQAISDAGEFGSWFGMEIDGRFAAGKSIDAKIAPTKVDPEVARMQEPHRGMPFSLLVERIEPMRLFSFRWHPYAVDPDTDYSGEPTTLVTFQLEEVPGGTQLTITETGFENIPLERRAEAFKSNDQGWAMQARLIEKYLQQAA